MIKRLLLLLLFFHPLLFPTPAFASSNFSISSDTTYTVFETGLTHVSLALIMTNTSSAYYASSYKIHMGFSDIDNLLVKDTSGPIKSVLTKTESGYTLDIPFNKKVVGVGNSQQFSISFDTRDVAENKGGVWEVNIPGIPNQNDFSGFNVHVQVPQAFGTPSYIKPLYSKDSFTTLDFTKDELQKSGIAIAFGQHQAYDFNLSYHLKNSNLFPITSEIALPPSTNYQDIFIHSITPKPLDVRIDEDGNWIAYYYVLPGEKKDIVAKGQAQVYLYPKKEELTEEHMNEYLKEQPYWEVHNSDIVKKARALKTPAEIYKFVVKTLTYDFDRAKNNGPRLGASQAMKNPSSAVCLEFTDLFIALARAEGIPARKMEGYANTKNSVERPLSLSRDVLHAWPEYYDRDLHTWIMVDPTWGHTTGGIDYFSILDFDHIAFAINGKNSQYPVAAGNYKISSSKEKDVLVKPAGAPPKALENIEASLEFKNSYTAGLPIQGYLVFKNTGTAVMSPGPVTIESTSIHPVKTTIEVGDIPPLGLRRIPLEFERTGFLTKKEDEVTISYLGKTITSPIRVSPFFLFGLFSK